MSSRAAGADSGYWLVDAKGNVYEFGGAPFKGSASSSAPVVAMAPTPSGQGYWLAAADGSVFPQGDAPDKGSMAGRALNRPVVGTAATPSGEGYWLVASDGGVFTFNAPFFGSGAAGTVDTPIVGITAVPDGSGYWMADAAGDVYNFGAAMYSGEADDCPLPAGIVGLVASGNGTALSTPPARPNCGLPIASTPPPPPPSGGGSSFQIGLIGDTGYTADQESLFRQARSHMNTFPLAFVIHDGDFKSGGSSCTDSKFRSAKDTFNGFVAPFIYTPGDNEWKDCADPLGRLGFLRSLFFSSSQSLGKNRITLTRQSGYPENARWVRGNVVFTTVNLPGSDGRSSSSSSETSARISADVSWIHKAFDEAENRGSPGVLIAWQDNPFGSAEPKTLAALKSRTKSLGKPVVLVHGDTHNFQIDHPWGDVGNFTRVETYATTQSDRWVLTTVNPSSSSVFSFSSKTAP